MVVKSLVKHSVGVVVVSAGALLAIAQPAPDPVPTPTPTAEAAVQVQLTVEEMTLQITTFEKDATEHSKFVVVLQIAARKEKDVIKLNCINDKLFQIKALRNIFDSAKGEFEAATNKDDQAKIFVRISANANSIRQLKEEALACTGEIPTSADTDSDWTGPDIPDDPGKDWFPDGIEPPGYASPFE
jgi:hypothetical protein